MVGIIKTSTRSKVKGHSSSEAAQKERQLTDDWDDLQAKHATKVSTKTWGYELPPGASRPTQVNKMPKGMVGRPIRDFGTTASGGPTHAVAKEEVKLAPHLRYSGEMLEREKKAQEETERKKKSVAPLANKMGYQYITDPADAKTIGRKV